MGRARSTRPLFWLTLCLSIAAGCDDGAAHGAGPSAPKSGAAALPAPDPGDPLAVGIYDLATHYGQHMVPFTPIWRTHLERGKGDDFTLVLQSGRCFRVLAAGTDRVDDLDLTLYDPNGEPLMQDTTMAGTATLGVESPICPPNPGRYRIEVTAFRGQGDVGLQVFRSQ